MLHFWTLVQALGEKLTPKGFFQGVAFNRLGQGQNALTQLQEAKAGWFNPSLTFSAAPTFSTLKPVEVFGTWGQPFKRVTTALKFTCHVLLEDRDEKN